MGLIGRHQGANAAIAIGVLEAIEAAGIARVGDAELRAGLAATRWPGRVELLALGAAGGAAAAGPTAVVGRPDLILDGAHNAAGAAALAATMDELAPTLSGGRATLLLGMMRDKEVTAVLDALRGSRMLAAARVLAVTVPDAPRALPAGPLARAWGGRDVEAWEELPAALARAQALARAEDGPLVVAGSLYLVGAVRGALLPAGETPRPPGREAAG
jgi:dihydrofolate synthase/folylpolyglutamate synthase